MMVLYRICIAGMLIGRSLRLVSCGEFHAIACSCKAGVWFQDFVCLRKIREDALVETNQGLGFVAMHNNTCCISNSTSNRVSTFAYINKLYPISTSHFYR